MIANGVARMPGGALRADQVAVNGNPAASSGPWQARLSPDRPAYDCPECAEMAMQFYIKHELHPGRVDFFYCHACGGSWGV